MRISKANLKSLIIIPISMVFAVGLWLAVFAALAGEIETSAANKEASKISSRQRAVLLSARDAIINGTVAQSCATVFDGSAISTGPKGIAVIDLGPPGVIELRPNTAIKLALSPGAAQFETTGERASIAVAAGNLTIQSPGAKILARGQAELLQGPVKGLMTNGAGVIVDCRGQQITVDPGFPAHASQEIIGKIDLLKTSAAIALHLALGGENFTQPPPQAADPTTP